MTEIINDLKLVIKEKGISPEMAARFIGCSGREVYRWLDSDNQPSQVYKKLIRAGIRRMRKNL